MKISNYHLIFLNLYNFMMSKSKLFRDIGERELASAVVPDNVELPFTDRELVSQSLAFPSSLSPLLQTSVRIDWLTFQGSLRVDDFTNFINYLQISLQDTFVDSPGAGGRCGVSYRSHMNAIGRGTYVAYTLQEYDVLGEVLDDPYIDFAIQLKGLSLGVFSSLADQVHFLGQLFLLFGELADLSCSRFDIAIDDYACGRAGVNRGFSEISPSFLYLWCPDHLSGFRKFSLIQSEGHYSDRGSIETLHLGSRFSSKFVRIYQKLHDNGLHSLRFEVEFKDHCAKYCWQIISMFCRAAYEDTANRDRYIEQVSLFSRGAFLGSFRFIQRLKLREAKNSQDQVIGSLITVSADRAADCRWWSFYSQYLANGAESFKISSLSRSTMANNLEWCKRSVMGSLLIYRCAMGNEHFLKFLMAELDHYLLRVLGWSTSDDPRDRQKYSEFRARVAFLSSVLGESVLGKTDLTSPDLSKFPCPAGISSDSWREIFEQFQADLLIKGLASPGLSYLKHFPSLDVYHYV